VSDAYEFEAETKREVMVAVTQELRRSVDGEDWKKIVRISIRHRDDHGHETEIGELDERDLYGKEVSLDAIVRRVEMIACHDAAYQFDDEAIYVLVFHGREHPNRSRFMFKIPSGQKVEGITRSRATPGASEDEGRGDPSPSIERVMLDVLKYVSERETRLDERSAHLWNAMINDYGSDNAKKRRKDQATEKAREELMEMFKTYAPTLVPALISAFERFSLLDLCEWYVKYRRSKGLSDRPAKEN